MFLLVVCIYHSKDVHKTYKTHKIFIIITLSQSWQDFNLDNFFNIILMSCQRDRETHEWPKVLSMFMPRPDKTHKIFGQ